MLATSQDKLLFKTNLEKLLSLLHSLNLLKSNNPKTQTKILRLSIS